MLLLVPKIDRGSVSERKCNVLQQDPHIIVGQLMPGQLLFPPTLDATETASTVVPLQNWWIGNGLLWLLNSKALLFLGRRGGGVASCATGYQT